MAERVHKNYANRACRSSQGIALALALTLLAGSSQGGQKVESFWKDTAWTGPPLTNVYVVALRPSQERRRWWEDGFVAGLVRYHVRATASYKKFRDASPDTQQVIDEVRANGYDGVLISQRLPDATTQTTTTTTQVVSEKRSFISNYSTLQIDAQESRTLENTVRSVRVQVWATGGGGRLLWTGTLRSDKDVNYDKVMKVTSVELADRLSKDGVLPPLPPKNP